MPPGWHSSGHRICNTATRLSGVFDKSNVAAGLVLRVLEDFRFHKPTRTGPGPLRRPSASSRLSDVVQCVTAASTAGRSASRLGRCPTCLPATSGVPIKVANLSKILSLLQWQSAAVLCRIMAVRQGILHGGAHTLADKAIEMVGGGKLVEEPEDRLVEADVDILAFACEFSSPNGHGRRKRHRGR